MGIYPERCDGPAINVYNLARNFVSLGEECHIIVGAKDPKNLKKSLKNENFNVYPFMKNWGGYKTHYEGEKYLSSFFTPFKLALYIPVISRRVINIINIIKPDILFYNLVPIDPLAPLPFFYRLQNKIQVSRIPVWFPLELKKFSKNKVNVILGNHVYKKIVSQFSVIVTQSTAMQQIIKEEIGITPPCIVIPNGVDLKKFTKKADCEHDRVRILFVGRLSREKGIEDLLQALSFQSPQTLSKIDVLIVGKGSPKYMLDLHEFSLKLGIRDKVTFHGEVDWGVISPIYKSSDIFVLPSYSEGFPQVLLEAMASGLAIIATNISGVQDVIKENNGMLFESGDVKKLSQHIETLVNDDKLRRSMSEKAYYTALNFSWRNIANRYLELFRYLMNSG